MLRPGKLILLAALAFLISTHSTLAETPSTAAVKTAIGDPIQKKKLLGKHMLSLQWISWDKFGTATVSEKNGLLHIKGEQKGQEKGKEADFVKIDGDITAVNKTNFKFKGKIETRVSHINDGKVCLRDGDMTFSIKGKRKYWRLDEMDNPCDKVTDYVDVYF